MPSIRDNARITGGVNGNPSIEEAAYLLWQVMLDECKTKGLDLQMTRYGEGYYYTGDVSGFAVRLWPLRFSKPDVGARAFLSAVRGLLKADGNVIVIERRQTAFNTHANRIFVTATYNQGTGATPVSAITGPLNDNGQPWEISVLEMSKRVWSRARQYALTNSVDTQEHGGRQFYIVDKPLSYFIAAEFPHLVPYEGGKEKIYDFLRSTSNAVYLGSRRTEGAEPPIKRWLIATEWSEAGTAVIIRHPRNPDRIDKIAERLTPHEAGEDREPGPVTVSSRPKEAPSLSESKPKFVCEECDKPFENQNALNGHKASHRFDTATDNGNGEKYILLENGKAACIQCGAEFDAPSSIPGHYKTHAHEQRQRDMERLEKEVARLRRLRRGQASDLALSRIAAIDVLTSSLEEFEAMEREVEVLRHENTTQRNEIRDLTTEVADLRAKQASGDDLTALTDLIGEVLGRVYAGSIGLSRAIADIEDLVNSQKKKVQK